MMMHNQIKPFEFKIRQAYLDGNIETAHRLENQLARLQQHRSSPVAEDLINRQFDDFHELDLSDYPE